MDGVERALYAIDEAAKRHAIDVPRIELCEDIDDALAPLLEGLEARIPVEARLVGGDLIVDATEAEVMGFMADPDRVLFSFWAV